MQAGASDLAAACVAGEVLGRLGVFEEIKGLPEKVPLTLSGTSLPQFLLCNVGESQSYLLRCLCGLMEMALAVRQLLPSLSLAVEAFQIRQELGPCSQL